MVYRVHGSSNEAVALTEFPRVPKAMQMPKLAHKAALATSRGVQQPANIGKKASGADALLVRTCPSPACVAIDDAWMALPRLDGVRNDEGRGNDELYVSLFFSSQHPAARTCQTTPGSQHPSASTQHPTTRTPVTGSRQT